MKKKINKRKNSLFSKLSKNSLKVILSFAMALTSIIGVNPNSVFNVAADSQDYDAGSVGQLSAVKFTQATAGQLGAIALDQSGAVWSWGYNINGRLGLGLTSTQQNYAGGMRRLPYFVDNGIEVVQVQSGYETNYALDSDGYVYTWGRGNEGQMGNGNTNNNNPTPLRVPGLPKIKEIVAGKGGQQHHILALDVNGKIWGWGYNAGNRIGLTNSGPAYHSTPSEVNVPDSVKFARIEVGDNHNIALDEDGGVWTWGHNTGGSLGNGSNTGTVDKPTKINIPSGVKAIDISASFNSSLVLDENHTVWQFGRVYGRTGGTGHAVSVNTPEAVQIKASEINEMGYTPIPQKIFAGESVSYFIDQHGRSWSWGSGRYNGFGREGGFITSQLQMESQAVQLPKVFGDGDTQNYDYNPKTPADGAQKNRGGNYGGYGFNQLHPTIYDDKYKDKPEDDIWKDLALKPLPKVRQIISSRSSYTMLDEDGNIMKWGYDGSGAVAWGWDYDPKYDQNGSLKTGLYDRYTYEVMFMRGAPQIAPIKLEISDTLEKIYKKEDNSQTDKVEITAEIPASYHSDSLNITIKPELQYMKYVVIPYDPTNTDFSQQDISKEVFDALYDSGKYEVGTLIDSVIESTDKKQIIKKELEISDNSRVIVMIGDKAYGRQLHTIAKHTADNFYTPTELMHEGVGVVDTVEEQLYDGTTDNVVKTNTDHDPTQYGIPLDVNGNVIASPKFGYDTVDISKYAVLPNNEDIYWNFKSGQVSPVSFNLDDVKFKLNEKFTHKFLYERNPENWITLSYDSEVLSTGDPVTGFVMPNDNPETVKKFIEIKRTPPTIEPYQLIGYRFDGGAINDLDDGNFVHTPLASANITFVYDVAEISGNKGVTDSDGDGVASPGETLHYTITAQNESDFKAKGISIKDTLTDVLPYIDDATSVVVTIDNGGVISTHSLDDLINGITVDIDALGVATATFSVDIIKTLDVTTVTKIKNISFVDDKKPEVEIPTGKSNVVLNKEVKDASGDNFASPGETLQYIITVLNDGTAKANAVIVKDTLSEVLPYVKDTSAVNVVVNNNGVETTHSVQNLIDGIGVDVLAGKNVTITFEVVVKDDLDVKNITKIANKATAGDEEIEIEIPTGKPEVKSNKTVADENNDGFASPGEKLTYNLTAENLGNVEAKNIVIKDTLDHVLPYIDQSNVSVILNNGGVVSVHTIDEVKNGLTVNIEAGAKVSVTFTVTVKNDLDVTTVTTIANKATIGDDEPEIEIPTGKPEVKSNKEVKDASGDNFASPGETLNYVITAENKGAVKAENVTIQDKLDNVLPHVEDTSSVVVTLNNNGAVSTHSVKDLIDGISVDIEAGAKVSVSFAVVVKANLDVATVTKISNKATVGETTPEIEIPTGDTDVLSAKEVNDASGDNFASPGETLNYVITAENKGAVKAENVTIQDKLDNVLPHVEDTSAVVVTLNNNGTISTHSVQDLIDGISVDIEAGAKVSVSFAVVVKTDLDVTTVTTISNKATVGETTPEIEIPTGKPEVKSNKEVNDASGDNFASPGETLNYVITAENKGAVKAENVTIQDKLDNVLPHVE
ncbi:DUF11 domain-containing protein, partial [Erysipelothrix tonsillarum]|uniref:RCC1 domain-containing protein n=1 Tax=Erysipelothrix tonsillarum TaxID=38402 RepID=UPI000584906B